MQENNWPTWAKQEAADSYGNATCAACGHVQSPSFQACISCCKHDELRLVEDWHGADEGGGWELDVECSICGKNFDFSRDLLMREYKVVRKTPNAAVKPRRHGG